MSTAMTPAKDNAVALRSAFESKIEIFKTLAGGDENVMRLLFIFQASAMRMPGLAECSQTSIILGLMKCAELKLDPNTNNQSWMLPFNNKVKIFENGREVERWISDAQWMPGYKGLEHLAMKSNPKIESFRTVLVYESEMKDFDLSEGSKPFIHHKPNYRARNDEERGAIVLGYATVHFHTGGEQFIWLPYEGEKESIMARARRSKTHKVDKEGNEYWVGPWKTDPIPMMKKTLSLSLGKRLDTNARDPLGKAIAYDDEEGDGKKPGDFDPRFALESAKPSKAAVAVSMYSKTDAQIAGNRNGAAQKADVVKDNDTAKAGLLRLTELLKGLSDEEIASLKLGKAIEKAGGVENLTPEQVKKAIELIEKHSASKSEAK